MTDLAQSATRFLQPRRYLDWRGWVRGFGGGVISGGASAVVSFFGLAGADAIGVDRAIDLRQAAAIFVAGAFIHAMLYLQKQPLPEEKVSNPPFAK